MPDLNALTLPELYKTLSQSGLVRRLLELAREEDLGIAGDVTSLASVSPSLRSRAQIVARQPGVISGLAVVPELVSLFAPSIRAELRVADGTITTQPSTTIAVLEGSRRELLGIERTLLNVIGRMSGVATTAHRFVAALKHGGPLRAEVYDTRKTTPGLRVLEKYAVRCGGARCHRIGLFDAMLVKDNHIAGVSVGELPEVIRRASQAARAIQPDLSFVQVEVDSLDQLGAILTLPRGVVDIVLLDNMNLSQLSEAVRLRDASESRPALEASGGVRLDSVRAIGETGVDRISAGAITHGAVWLDIAMDIDA